MLDSYNTMSQENSTVNFLIHGANGQPQVVKVVQNPNNQSSSHVKINSNPVKLIKIPTTKEGEPQRPILRALKLTGIKGPQKLIEVPVEFTSFQKITTKPESKETVKLEVEYSNQTTDMEYALSRSNVPGSKSRAEATVTSTSAAKGKAHATTTMAHGTRRRRDSDNDPPTEYTTKRRKHADKVGKGLRHFSMKVCEKVRTKGFTSYNEVADELVLEFAAGGMHGSSDSQQYDQKNIRRRVYDALNVLMAMNIISKEKKEIRWLGLPTNSIQECTALEKEKQAKLERIQKKTQQLQELILQHISFKSLIARNKEAESKGLKPSPSSAIHLPFIVVNTSDKALIDCSISNDKTEYMFNFNKRFQIHDDIDILKRMGLLYGVDKGECSEADIEKVKTMVPKSLEYYLEQMGRGLTGELTNILEEDIIEQVFDEESGGEVLEASGEVGAEGEEAEGEEDDAQEYSEDSSDVDV